MVAPFATFNDTFLGALLLTVKSFFRCTDKKISTCKNCGKMLTILEKRKPKKFCNDNCRITFWRRNKRKKENENTSNDVSRAV